MARQKYGKNTQGLYETSKTYDGKRVKFRGKTCAIVDQKIREYEEGRKRGRKLQVVIYEWLAWKENKISESSYRVYCHSVERLDKFFQDRYISTITALDCDRYINYVEGRGYAKQTVSLDLTVMKQVFSYAVRKAGDIPVNPAREISISRGLPEKKRGALTEEQERLVEDFRGENWLLGIMLLYTGCRRGELLALNWQDIDRKAGVIHIDKKLNWIKNTPKLEGHLKNADRRDIPLFGVLAEKLPKNRLGIIFPGEDGGYLTNAQITKLWKKYCTDAGLEGVTPHCFRHSYSTICFEAGIPEKDAAAFLGDTEEIMRKVYTELRSHHVASSAERVNAYLELRREEQKQA